MKLVSCILEYTEDGGRPKLFIRCFHRRRCAFLVMLEGRGNHNNRDPYSQYDEGPVVREYSEMVFKRQLRYRNETGIILSYLFVRRRKIIRIYLSTIL